MEQALRDYLISLNFEEISPNYFKRQEITLNYAESAYHLSFYLEPYGDITLVNRIDERRFSRLKIDNFIDSVNYIKNKLY
jgi:hypothetical protein